MDIPLILLIVEFVGLFIAGFLLRIPNYIEDIERCMKIFKAVGFFGLLGIIAGVLEYFGEEYPVALIIGGGIGAFAAGLILYACLRSS